ncbi:HAMP domain-containing sensor histidine kinase [Clostridium oceanicum]|uniref:histidine kinase n=1 Tax=Clostridium oceanicum TaxID=1543 RepID=A0ABN1JG23_9CLOT
MRISIRYKFIIVLLSIFCIGFTLISFVTGDIIFKNNKKIIKNELLKEQRDSTFFIKQYLELNFIEDTADSFEKNSEQISLALSSKLDEKVVSYSKDGIFLFDTIYKDGNIYNSNGEKVQDNKEDLKSAKNGDASYSILKMKDKFIISFSNPIYINKKMIGIIRYTRDYTSISQSGNELLKLIKGAILAIFIIIFLFILILSNIIVIPVIKLSKASKEISKGNYDFPVEIKSRDEIGELTENFIDMKECIKEQIDTIEKDKNKLEILQKHRKIFFDNATHEMKTPLTIISGYAQIIGEKGFDDKEFFYNAIEKIKYEADKMYNMTLNLLDMSKLESNIEVEYKNINISQIVNRVCEDMTIKSNKYNISIDKKIEENIYILGSKEQIRRMIINIIDNSIKYSKVNTKIEVEMKLNNNECYITVEDEGVGIAKDKLDKIFKPFYRVNNNLREKESSGLGLSIVDNIVKSHRGKIKIESEENLGTKISVIIPVNFL